MSSPHAYRVAINIKLLYKCMNMYRPELLELITASSEHTIAARYTMVMDLDGSEGYRVGAVVGLTDPRVIADGLQTDDGGNYVIPLERAVVASMAMPKKGRINVGHYIQQYHDNLRLQYDGFLPAPDLLLDRESIGDHVGDLMHDVALREPGAVWKLSVLGSTAFSAAQRGLFLASDAIPIEESKADDAFEGTALDFEQLRADSLYALAMTLHRRLYEMSPKPPVIASRADTSQSTSN
jgi:hypothetical protein